MGAQIACLLAAAGAQVHLLDLDEATAADGLARALKLRPSPTYRPQDVARIRSGGFDDLPAAVADADWILEAVVERLEPKRALFARVDEALSAAARRPWPIVSTNTSGISIAALAAGRSDDFRRAFLGTHFFNPPRYTRLLELIPITTTAPHVIETLEDYAPRHLGKGTVRAKDTPAFIANRLGVYGLQRALALAQELGLGVDEVDELTGPLIGRPKSATFRTLDVVGLDVAVAVADHCHADLPDDPQRDVFVVAPILRRLIERGSLGEKAGAGFFKREGGEILALDLTTGDYRPRRRISSPTVEAARNERDLGARLRLLVAGDDAASRFLWGALSDGITYAADVADEIAGDLPTIDRAMRLGFGWQLGPFETWDALGVAATMQRLRAEDRAVPAIAQATVAGAGRFTPAEPAATAAASPTASGGLPGNAAASMRELGEGILGLELHGKLNIIGADTLAMVRRAVDLAATRYDGLVIGTEAGDFSAGANLALMLVAAEEGDWDELERGIRAFQDATQAIRYAAVPVVLAPRGLTLGGGAEMALAAARRQPLAETYLGLVETGVGLIPAGGGSTATARRIAERAAGTHADRFAFFQAAVETIAFARVSTSAEEARSLGYLADGDLVSASPERQWSDAARVAATLAEVGYRPSAALPITVVGRRGLAAAEALTYNQLSGHQLSDHDRKVVLELAGVLSGGDVAEGTELAEAYLLELERAAFLRLLGEPLTRARIRHTLKTGKPLRN